MLGRELKKARIAAGLTQEELAFRADISRNYVSLLELDEKSPTVQMLLRLCKVTGVKASAILARIEGKK
jgi:transcriptional regulator with XRE-family HTH domain